MELSYWEDRTWFSDIDFTVVGSGIVGLTTAVFLKETYPSSKVLVLEKGLLPQGASTKNAGFACFGSISEITADLGSHSEDEVVQLVRQRFEGIQLLRQMLGDKNIEFERLGGHEIFLKKDTYLYDRCKGQMARINMLLKPIFKENPFQEQPNLFGFKGVQDTYITHRFEGQLHTGKMMLHLLKKAQCLGVTVLNGMGVDAFEDGPNGVHIKTEQLELFSKKLFVATNGFAAQLLDEKVKPARAQVLVTHPIENLRIKGTFHFDEGYYYFRNIEGRILFGGGRNLDLKGEETAQFGTTGHIQEALEQLLAEVILPGRAVEIDRRWSGIMGVGPQKRPIVKQHSDHVYCGIRLGGMGVAIGSLVGRQLASMA
ncbi:MAG: FAD-dependent oxidoreductase [Muricauda sp.]|nr:FAD-dependent oxidoreductase [Allomuricauda sp.]MAU27456.1 FAD-dependent oxidoreductase [Allomuricauda sp.]MBC30244.1 FAD-dependent oxidoreductase [Allomuricauda sp.]|tara:strand:+ start:10080 stop:11192 length:1113 start_codon:yes stop_codon:yes gene_type:complete